MRSARLTPTDRVAARASGAAAKDWAWYVGGFGITALVLAFLAFFLSANDGAVREQYLNWDAIDHFLPELRKGLWLNIKVFVVAEILVLGWGLVLALARIFPGKAGRPVRFLAVAYIDLFRGFPAIITILLVVLGFQAGDVPLFDQLEGETKLFWLCTTLLSVVGLLEVLGRARLASAELFNLSPNMAAGVAFVIITIPLARFTDWLIARQARARAGG